MTNEKLGHVKLNPQVNLEEQISELLDQIKSDSENFSHGEVVVSKSHMFIKLLFLTGNVTSTLTLLDLSTSGNLKSTLSYFAYIINSMYKS